MSVEAPKAVEETPVVKPAVEAETAPATESPIVAVDPAIKAEDATGNVAEDDKLVVVEAVPASEGVLGYKAPGFLKQFHFSKNFFWFSDEPSTADALKKAELPHAHSAWAQETGKGVLFYTKRAEDKAHPAGLILLSDASKVQKEGPTEFQFTVGKKVHRFEAATTTERDGWIVAIEKAIKESTEISEEVTARDSYKKTLEAFAVSPAHITKPERSSSKSASKAVETPAETAAAPTETTPVVAAAPAVADAASVSSSDKEAKKAEKEEKKAEKEAKKERSQSRKRNSIFGFLGQKEEDPEAKKAEKEKKEADKAAKEAEKEAKKAEKEKKEAEKAAKEAEKEAEKAAKDAEKEIKKAEAEHIKEEKKVEAELKKEEAKATHETTPAVAAVEAAAVAAAPAAVVAAVEDKKEEKAEKEAEKEKTEATTPTEKKAKRSSVFGSLFSKKVTSPTTEKTEKEATPIAAPVAAESEVPPVSETAPKLDEPIENKPIDTAAVTAPVDTTETPVAETPAVVAAEEPVKETAASPAVETTPTKSEKKGGFLGFIKKSETKKEVKEEKKEEATEEIAKDSAATTTTTEPAIATAGGSAVTGPSTETPIVDATKDERPAREKRRSSFFSSLGTIKKKVAPESAETEGEAKREKSPLPSKLGGLFRKSSKATKPTGTEPEVAPVATETKTEEVVKTDATETPANATIPEPTDSKIVGDVVPADIATGSLTHDAVTVAPTSDVKASA